MKKLFQTVACLSCLLCGLEPVFAANGPAPDLSGEKKKQDSLRAVRAEKLAIFRQSHPGITTSIDEVTGAPYQLYGDLSAGLASSDPTEATYEFFEKNKDLYGINAPRLELKVANIKKHSPKQGGGTLVQLEQFYGEVKVSRGHFKVVFNAAGKLSGITGVFSPNVNLSPKPSIDSMGAIGIAKRDINYTPKEEKLAFEKWGDIPTPKGIKKGKPPVNASLLVIPFKEQYRLVWIIGLAKADSPGIWEFWIDAHSGAILQKKEDANIIREPSQNRPAPSRQDSAPIPSRPKEDTPERFKKSSIAPQLVPLKKDSTFVWPAVPRQPAPDPAKKKEVQSEDSAKEITLPAELHLPWPADSIAVWRMRQQGLDTTRVRPKSPDSNLQASPASLVTINSQDFEAYTFPVPGTDWTARDNNGAANGDYFWGKDTYLPFGGFWSAWCARGGADRDSGH